MSSLIEKRKKEHLELCIKKNVSFKNKTTLFECLELDYFSLPEINFLDVNLKQNFLGKNFSFPFLVSAITGGTKSAKKINEDIAIACQKKGVGFGLGSMRPALENNDLLETYFVRDLAPDIFISGNLGVSQLKEYSAEKINEVVEKLGLDAIAIHINSAQEAMQPEGNVDFSNLFEEINIFSKKSIVPVYVKEVGHGINFNIAKKLLDTKISAIDIQGAGGTSWTRVDSLRNKKSFGKNFRDFGLPTAISLIEVKKAVGNNKKIIASGGIRTGLEGVKSIILGADLVGNALPILKVQQKNSVKGILNYLDYFEKEMLITSFLLGCKNIDELRKQKVFMFGKLKEWIQQNS